MSFREKSRWFVFSVATFVVAFPVKAQESLETIRQEFMKAHQNLERELVGRLARLAEGQPPQDAAVTYEEMFQVAITNGFYREVEPIAERLIAKGSPSKRVKFFAQAVNIIAEADRGAYEESLVGLEAMINDPNREPTPEAQVSVVITLADAYLNRLTRVGRYDVAVKAFRKGLESSKVPAIREYFEHRLARLEMVGKPAPEIVGADLDGKPFRLSDHKGRPVLLVFWATWNTFDRENLKRAEDLHNALAKKGFRVVGVNVDMLQAENDDEKAVVSQVRRYVLDLNIPWNNIITGPGPNNAAKTYAIQDIPASVLIDRSGKVVALDIGHGKAREIVEKVVEEAASGK